MNEVEVHRDIDGVVLQAITVSDVFKLAGVKNGDRDFREGDIWLNCPECQLEQSLWHARKSPSPDPRRITDYTCRDCDKNGSRRDALGTRTYRFRWIIACLRHYRGMPNLREEFSTPRRNVQRYRVKATNETGTALSETNGLDNVGRLVTIGNAFNVPVIDLCDDNTGEIRTFRADRLERIEATDDSHG
ncbi:hypothetical protein [Paenarthrobacter ureafaciens]|uniref:hypothetical protein n=1 Tax=Paenarthrobacter ureafaciens TaxID=37931 RepID=UPI003CF8A28F